MKPISIKRKGIWLARFVIVAGFIIGLIAFNSSQTPARSQVQKIYDDFFQELAQRLNAAPEDGSQDSIASTMQTATIEFVAKSADENEVLRYSLDWKNRELLKKAMRMLELFKLANVFSLSRTAQDPHSQYTLRVIGASGYKFEGRFGDQEIRSSPPLSLALVLLRELATQHSAAPTSLASN